MHPDCFNPLNIDNNNFLDKSKILCKNASQMCYFSKSNEGHSRVNNSIVFKQIEKDFISKRMMYDKNLKGGNRFTNVIKDIFVPGSRKSVNRNTNSTIGKMREDGSFHAINHRSALISPTISKNRNSKIASSAISEYTKSNNLHKLSNRIKSFSEKLVVLRHKNK